MPSFSEEIFQVCQVSERIYAFNTQFRRSNFYGQQIRALALVEAFEARGWFERGQRSYLVVGAGVTGMTAAAALLTLGGSVTLVDRSRSLQEYTNASHRELHPNIISWPFQEMRAITDLPFLNWHCAPASDVVHQLSREWNEHFAAKVEQVTGTVTGVSETTGGVMVECADGQRFRKDRVVIASGFDLERKLGDNRTPGYWNLQPISREREMTVSGSGDGALIDAVYQLYGIEGVAAARVMAYAMRGHSALVDDIRMVEELALAERDAGQRGASTSRLDDFYSKMAFPADVVGRVTALQTGGISFGSRIVHRASSAFDAYAAPANKALLALSMAKGTRRIRDAAGEAVQDDVDNNFYIVDGADREQIDSGDLVVRHGADHNLGKILDAAQMATLAGKNSPELTAIVPDAFNRDLFVRNARQPIAPSNLRDPGRFYKDLEEHLFDLIRYVDKRVRNVEIQRRRAEEVAEDAEKEKSWVVSATIDETSALPSVFPVKISTVTITLSAIRPALAQF